MLAPDDRSTLLELLEPPVGFELDAAVGLTYTLDLDALLTLPTAFALRGGASQDDAGVGDLTPLAVLDALRSYSDRMTICCDAAGIRLPSGNRLGIFAFLEKAVVRMMAPRGGVFHPKAWIVRFRDDDHFAVHRLLVSSRNLTFDRSWDTVVQLNEDETGVALPGMSRLLDACVNPSMVVGSLDQRHRDRLESLSATVARARFIPPPGFTSMKVHPIGISDTARPGLPFPREARRALIVSPFLTRAFLERFPSDWTDTCLVSRGDEMDREVPDLGIGPDTPAASGSGATPRSGFFCLTPSAVDEASAADKSLSGLHAKLFVMDAPGGQSRVFTGSANATTAAFESNVEMLVEMGGSTRDVGVTTFLGPDGLGPLLLMHEFTAEPYESLVDPVSEHLEALRRALGSLVVLADVTPAGHGRYQVRYHSTQALPELGAACLELRPITVATWATADRPGILDHELTVDEAGISGFLAARLTEGSQSTSMVLSAALNGVPDGRDGRIISSLLADPVRLIRYLMMLLLDRPEDRFDGVLQEAIDRSRSATHATLQSIPLLEVMARALLGPSAKLHEVDRLLNELENGSDLVDQDLRDLWRSMRSAAGLDGLQP